MKPLLVFIAAIALATLSSGAGCGGDGGNGSGGAAGAGAAGASGALGGGGGSGSSATAGAAGSMAGVAGGGAGVDSTGLRLDVDGAAKSDTNATASLQQSAGVSILEIRGVAGGTFLLSLTKRTGLLAPASFSCASDALMSLAPLGDGHHARPGRGSCTAVLTSYGGPGGRVAGTFSGTVANDAGSQKVIANGTFDLSLPR